mmetsp:Transcript_10103/g.30458  ORF Transcript_10103/g.30458 Transcript_10103/m.30458 type:complete len:221 (-) Transcript_10103:92-754(-)
MSWRCKASALAMSLAFSDHRFRLKRCASSCIARATRRDSWCAAFARASSAHAAAAVPSLPATPALPSTDPSCPTALLACVDPMPLPLPPPLLFSPCSAQSSASAAAIAPLARRSAAAAPGSSRPILLGLPAVLRRGDAAIQPQPCCFCCCCSWCHSDLSGGIFWQGTPPAIPDAAFSSRSSASSASACSLASASRRSFSFMREIMSSLMRRKSDTASLSF